MRVQDLERHDHGPVSVEICFGCAGLWLGHLVSVQLAPMAVIQLFKQIHEHRDDERRALSDKLTCPRCHQGLILSFDLGKAGRFSYFRCPQGDGRFTPFVQFLREKQFIRTVTGAELQHLRSQVRQIRCSDCGAPIDLEHESQCSYCHAPISFLDPEGTEKALRMWSAAQDQRRVNPDSSEAMDLALQRARLNDGILLDIKDTRASSGNSIALDLVSFGIDVISRLLVKP